MLPYDNRTRFSAIVTIKIESTDNPGGSILTGGAGELLEKSAAVATLFAVRSAS